MPTAPVDTYKELLKERRQLAGEIEKLTGKHLNVLRGLNDLVDVAEGEVAKARALLREVTTAHRIVCSDRLNVVRRFDVQRDALQGRLLSSAPPEIYAFIAEMRAESGDLQLTGAPGSVTARRNRLADLQAACLEAEGLKLRALSHEELEVELARIRGEIPSVEAGS